MNSPPPRHLVVGTSGHIDHGKSTLIKALTGTDPDRLAEEKARGITIDLGFAHWVSPQGVEIAFVDVPGHERFVHNMLAGAAGMDGVLLVVAADKGVMPQTLEHLSICHLLGLRRGVVALTRTDLADPDLIALSRQEVSEALEGTFLEGAPMVEVSAVTGQGLGDLQRALEGLAGDSFMDEHREDVSLPFRFPVDRVFTMKGFGTVVTGTVVSGGLTAAQPLVVLPGGRSVRVRGMQVHGQAALRVEAGQRAALNLAGIDKQELQRGDQLAAPGSLLESHMLNVRLFLLATLPKGLTHRSRVRVHLAAREVLGRVVLLDGEGFTPGETRLAQLRLESPAATRYGDRFIIRNYSPVFTLGGGMVIDPSPVKSRHLREGLQERLTLLAGPDPASRVEQAVYLQSTRGVRLEEGAIRTGLTEKQYAKHSADLASRGVLFAVNPAEKRMIHADTLERVAGAVIRLTAAHHQKFPEREGITQAELGGKLAALYGEKEVAQLLARLTRQGRLVLQGHAYRLPDHEKSLGGGQSAALEALAAQAALGGLQPERKTALLTACGLDAKTGTALLKLAVREGLLVQIKEDLFYPPQVVDHIIIRLKEYLSRHQKITVIDFKELLAISRKHAVDLLEYFDGQKLTLRLENERVLRQ